MEVGVFQHLVNGLPIEEPFGWKEFTEKVERDYDLRLIGVKYPIDLTFVGSAYTYLQGEYAANPCALLPYVAQMWDGENWQTTCIGTLVLADAEWNLSKATVAISIADDNIGARILNNRKVQVIPTAIKTKLGDDMAPCPPIDLDLFNPGDPAGTWIGTPRRAFDWLELLRHVVTHITGSFVTIESSWYEGLPDDERWAVTDIVEMGAADLTVTDLAPDFETLWGDMARLYCLMAAVERDSYGNPVLRIEPESYFYGSSSTIVFPNQPDLIRKTEPDRLISVVNLGSKEHFKQLTPTPDRHLPYLRLRGFVTERVTLRSECNTDSELDLTTTYITDSNVIEEAIGAGADKDGDFVFIQYDHLTSKATKGDYLNPGSGPYLYNEAALNINVLNRWPLPFDAIVEVGDDDDRFVAVATYGAHGVFTYTGTGQSGPFIPGTTPYRFDDDYSGVNGATDPNDNYGNGTTPGNPVSAANSRYTAPIQGYYTFKASIPWQLTENTYGDFGVRLVIAYKHKDSANTVIGQGQGGVNAVTATGTYGFNLTFALNMQVGDYVEIYAGWAYAYILPGSPRGPAPHTFSARFLGGATFRTDFVAQGGGVVTPADPDAYYATIYDFERYLSIDKWIELREDASLAIQVGPDGNVMRGYIMEAERNAFTGKTTWKLIANRL